MKNYIYIIKIYAFIILSMTGSLPLQAEPLSVSVSAKDLRASLKDLLSHDRIYHSYRLQSERCFNEFAIHIPLGLDIEHADRRYVDDARALLAQLKLKKLEQSEHQAEYHKRQDDGSVQVIPLGVEYVAYFKLELPVDLPNLEFPLSPENENHPLFESQYEMLQALIRLEADAALEPWKHPRWAPNFNMTCQHNLSAVTGSSN